MSSNKKSSARTIIGALMGSVAVVALGLGGNRAFAQAVDIGAVDVAGGGVVKASSGEGSVGSAATPGSAPALAPSQGNLKAAEPSSIVSDKVIRDVIKPSGDYNETAKFTPGFITSNPNGAGDTKSGWRGFSDGQFNITFDGIPFGDANDPSHHSQAYFPSPFLGQVVVDRAPGPASQVGYATFGGTLSLLSRDVSDKRGGDYLASYGNFGTFATSFSLQSGLLPSNGKFLLQYSHAQSNGVLSHGNVRGDFGLVKFEQPLGDMKATVFSSIGQEHYLNVAAISYSQLQAYGKNYGGLSNNPAYNTFYGYNTSVKQTDFEYLDLKGNVGGFHVDNKFYTYSYFYPDAQVNGANTAVEGPATITSIKVPQANGVSVSTKILGVGATDATGFLQYNNLRAYGDIFKINRDIEAGLFSGNLRTGIWLEHADNYRSQQYKDFSKGQTFTALGNPANVSYKLLLNSHIQTVQPFVEYEWRPTEQLTITPGYKFEAFTRDHNAVINQTTLAALNYSQTYTGNLPFLTVHYRLNDSTAVYAQVSRGMLAPPTAAFYVFAPGENTVKPQMTTNYQTGVVYKSDKITADADVYLINATHFSSSFTDSTGATFYKDGGNATYKGFEGEVTYALVDGLSLYSSGSVGSAKYTAGTNAGLDIGGAPTFTAAGGVIYDNGHLFGSLLTQVTGEHWGTRGSDQVYGKTINRVPTYTSTDAVLGYRTDINKQYGLGQLLEIKGGVNNILDSRTVTDIFGTPSTNTASTAGLTYQFQPARTFYVAAKLSF